MAFAMPEDPGAQGTQVEGRYANSFHVGHNAAEFVVDFGQYFPADAAEQMHAIIPTRPAKTLGLAESTA
jgi:hypothetical protein